MVFERVLLTVAPLVIIVAAGYLYGRFQKPDISAANKMNMDLFCPALILSVMSAKSFEPAAYGNLMLGCVIVVLGSGLLLWPIARLAGFNPRAFLPPMMFNNSGNMGIPLIVLAFGEEAMAVGVVLFIVEMVLHFTVGLYVIDHRTRLINILRIPMILATIAGLALSLLDLSIPQWFSVPVDMLGQICIPLMMFSLGVRLCSVDLTDWRIGLAGAIACPLSGVICAAFALVWLPLSPLESAALMVFGALPPAVLNYMVAEQYKLEPARVASIVMLGNLASLVTIPLVLTYVLS
ncbi:AEC family transporter [Aestuariirhabdus litorea]|uniref:AEC family transporter n=1 Tax=Aestuariirhabdus litorea TaxID=2528527 RepID=A0A3P3VLI0_9GAMM|nr:AEC family transporter [Aestuariirhabdus litorea]RRJ83187.1 AEC family transporter [Aestuariirhabdus litorea]RWW93344.1 AEC family transporter [Endozoicomonadaceae bacterium GTF-13]